MIIATAGHVDHGKTLLVRALTGVDTDRLPEEKRRGLTIDLGFAYLPVAGATVGFIDVPGHERFVATMLAGVAGVDHVLLVVAADDGPMPQTLEHLAIVDLLGIGAGTIVISKTDRVGADRVAEVAERTRALLAGSSIAGAPVFPVAALDGTGVDALRDHIAALAAVEAPRPAGRFRLAIDRRFTVPGIGLVATGTVFAGSVVAGDRLALVPGGGAARVRGLHAQNRAAAAGGRGQRLALNLTGIDKDSLHRGAWVVDPAIALASDRLDVVLRLPHRGQGTLRHGSRVHVHLGAAEVLGRVDLLEHRTLAAPAGGLAQLVLELPVGALHGDRVVLRDRAARLTVAGGRVLDPVAPARGRRRPERLAFLQALDHADPVDRLRAVLAAAPDGVDLGALAMAWNIAPDAWAEVERGAAPIVAEAAGRHFGMARETWAALVRRVAVALPPEGGVAGGLCRGVPRALVEAALAELANTGAVVRDGAMFVPAGRPPPPDLADLPLWRAIAQALDDAGRKVPVVVDLAAAVNADGAAVEALLVRAEKVALVRRVARNRFVSAALLARLAGVAAGLSAEQPDGFATAAFRDRAGVGRNLAIEVLEHFDRTGLTRRRGDRRLLDRP